jgi:large subunit ribosomal protein L21
MPRIPRRARTREREFSVYAIVRCGGRQEKASVDDVLTVDKLAGEVGSSVTLPAVLVIDDDKVISDPAEVGSYQITAEIVGAAAGPKINMIHYKNKTGYRRRLGHRQKYTQVKITSIASGKSSTKAGASKASTARSSSAKAGAGKADTDKASTEKASTEKASASSARSGSASSRKKD